MPSLSTGATDSRFLRNVGIPCYGISGLFTDPADNRAHGLNERIPVKSLDDGQEFLYRLIRVLAGGSQAQEIFLREYVRHETGHREVGFRRGAIELI